MVGQLRLMVKTTATKNGNVKHERKHIVKVFKQVLKLPYEQTEARVSMYMQIDRSVLAENASIYNVKIVLG